MRFGQIKQTIQEVAEEAIRLHYSCITIEDIFIAETEHEKFLEKVPEALTEIRIEERSHN